eukprot:6492773-Amphidinium_carterae.7
MKGPGLVTSSGTSFALLDFLPAVASAHTHDSDDGEEPVPKKHKPSSSTCAGPDASWKDHLLTLGTPSVTPASSSMTHAKQKNTQPHHSDIDLDLVDEEAVPHDSDWCDLEAERSELANVVETTVDHFSQSVLGGKWRYAATRSAIYGVRTDILPNSDVRVFAVTQGMNCSASFEHKKYGNAGSYLASVWQHQLWSHWESSVRPRKYPASTLPAFDMTVCVVPSDILLNKAAETRRDAISRLLP